MHALSTQDLHMSPVEILLFLRITALYSHVHPNQQLHEWTFAIETDVTIDNYVD